MVRKLVTFILLILIISVNESAVLLYDTEMSVGNQEIDCIYYVRDFTVKYCFRWGKDTILQRPPHNCSNGEKWSFSRLLEQDISPWGVLSWSSSVERAEDYARVYYDRSIAFEENDFLCNCTEKATFGKNCEYRLLSNSSAFSDALQMVYDAKKNTDGHQMWGSIPCYITLICNFGKLCLDWRNICDRMQSCMDGIDEENCDMLEFNECQADEYRCLNGMCIPEEYWLDGKSRLPQTHMCAVD
jgi:hypothetical protein